MTAPAGRCPRCRCGDCGGRLDEHTATGCGCEACQASPSLACSLAGFLPEQRLTVLAEALAPWLSAQLNERMRLRSLAAAHAAYHALHDYDYPGDDDA